MPGRYLKFVKGNFYHVYNRGANKQKIFFETDNYLYLLKLLNKNTTKYCLTVIAYCLMPNHYHLLLRVDGEKDLSRCISTTFNSYVQAINKRYDRASSLFLERFKAIHIDKEAYLLHLCRYIHLNPINAQLIANLEDWPFSNYLEFIGKRNGTFFERVFFQKHFGNCDAYYDFVHDVSIQPPENFGDYLFE